MNTHPRICFGIGLHNCARYLPAAIESILGQTYEDFRIVTVDDCSTDNTPELMQHYTARDSRLKYYRNDIRQGEVITWTRAFKMARAEGLDYFAWGTDHDLWHPDWLKTLVGVLSDNPEVVLAYPLTAAIDEKGDILPIGLPEFQTDKMNQMDRVRTTCTELIGAGNMIYGLLRADAAENCGIFPSYALPDRLLMLKLSVFGTFKQVKETLWYRRYFDVVNNKIPFNYEKMILRQRVILYPENSAPWYSNFPALGQAIGLIMQFGVRPPGNSHRKFFLGFYMAILHLITKRRNLKKEIKLFIRRLMKTH